MNAFIDYYAVLGVDPGASSSTIKAAFKKLALQYHPDVYKREDAQERMRLLLAAYQTLSDADSRQEYDREHRKHVLDDDGEMAVRQGHGDDAGASPSGMAGQGKETLNVRGGQLHIAFPHLEEPFTSPVEVDVGEFTYTLWPDDARILRQEGMLRGAAPEVRRDVVTSLADARAGASSRTESYCHRCHHRWMTSPAENRAPGPGTVCPACKASDWAEYLLLRCVHCHAVFESREIRDDIVGGRLYFPYELFPLCPNCRRSHWCPAENERVDTLRAAAARRSMILWMSVVVVVALIIGVMLIAVLK